MKKRKQINPNNPWDNLRKLTTFESYLREQLYFQFNWMGRGSESKTTKDFERFAPFAGIFGVKLALWDDLNEKT